MGDPITSTALAVVAGGSVIEQREQTRAARRDANRARDAERRLQNVKASRERRKAVRAARMQRAQIESGAVASGTSNTSGFAGGAGGVQTQLASNLSFLNKSQELTNEQSIFKQRAANHEGRAKDMADLRNLAFQGASLFSPGG
jgi:hypothetical protein